MDEEPTFLEIEKPRYLLPEGCKDLNDVIRLQESAAFSAAMQKHFASAVSAELGKHVSEPALELPACVTLPDTVTVSALAELLHVEPYRLISTLIMLHVFASAESEISFAVASSVCAYYGVEVHKA